MLVSDSDSEVAMRRLLAFLLLFAALGSISASPELWIGASFFADRNNISEDVADCFPAMGDSVSEIKSIGLDLDLAFFPSDVVRIGLIGGYNIMLPIGFTETGGSNEGYITYDFDYRQDLSIGLAYYQFFTSVIGAFLTCNFEYSWYRTASEHIPNDSAPMDYIEHNEYGVSGELGIITRSDNMYFRLGFKGYYDLYHAESHGYRLGLFAGGGIIIG